MSSDSDALPETDAVLARRVQMLATEHWGLLAARGTAQSEVLTRITIFLTLVSAGLLTIGLLGQATRFSGWFAAAALSILGFLALVGALTQLRVMAVSEEDLMYVLAMNRLRGAYVELDPGIAPYLMASTYDDRVGMGQTYSFIRQRRDAEQVLASSAFLSFIVNGIVFGMFAGGLCAALGVPTAWAIAVAIIVGLAILVISGFVSGREFLMTWRLHTPLRRSPGTAQDE